MINVYDVLGRKVIDGNLKQLNSGSGNLRIDVVGLKPGQYIVEIQLGQVKEVQSFIKL